MSNFWENAAAVGGGLAGYYLGGDYGAGIGAFAGKKLAGGDTKHAVQAGLMGYGGAKALDWGQGYFNTGTNLGGAGGQYLGDQYSGFGGSGSYLGNSSSSPWYGTPTASSVGQGFSRPESGGLGMDKLMMLGGLSAMGSSADQQSAIDSQNRALATWRSTAFPQSSVINSQRTDAVNTLNQQYQLAARKFSEDMAARGISPNSKVYQSQMLSLDMNRRKAMSEMTRKLIEFQDTPMQGAPIYNTATPSAIGDMSKLVAGITGRQYGSDLYNSMR